jgi:multisubunit Na+/H+ antiporter MnhE subunit
MKYWVTSGLIGGFVGIILLAFYSLITSVSQAFTIFIIGFIIGAVIGIAIRELIVLPRQLKLINTGRK